jgi:ribosome-binding protein aMBF1 (putative translation factor)
MIPTPTAAPEVPVQDIRALVQEMRKRLMLTTEQFAKRLKEHPTVVNRWQYSAHPPTTKTLGLLKKVLIEMGDVGSDLLTQYNL